jgi:hypothetical protein
MILNIQIVNENKFSLNIDKNSTVLDLKKEISKKSNKDINDIKMVFGGKVLENEKDKLTVYKLEDNYTIIVVIKKDPPPNEPDDSEDEWETEKCSCCGENHDDLDLTDDDDISGDFELEQSELNDINELKECGFNESDVVKYYLISGKNKEVAANLLINGLDNNNDQ